MIYETIFAGSGGQGILLMGKILATAGMLDNKNVTWFPSYGAEMRGGTANCSVVISEQLIGSPIAARPLAAITMNQSSVEKFAPLIKAKGFLFINSSLTKRFTARKDIQLMCLPVTEIADTLGTTKLANIIALSAFCTKTGIVSWESLEKAIEHYFCSKNKTILQMNYKALCLGRQKALVYINDSKGPY